MAEISWIKLKTTMFDDEKIRLIQSIPEADAIIVIWIRLLVLAGKTNDDGLIYIQRNMPFTDEMLATLFGKPVSVIRLALTTLSNFNMIDINDDGVLSIENWEKHQNVDGMDKVKKLNAERNKRYRERKKLESSNSDVSVTSRMTLRDAIDIDKDLDKDLDKEKDIRTSSLKKDDGVSLKNRFEIIWGKYPNGRKQGKERAFNSYKKAIKEGTTDNEIVNGLNDYKKQIEIQETDTQYIKQGSTWFSGKCWQDDYTTEKTNNETKRRVGQYDDLF